MKNIITKTVAAALMVFAAASAVHAKSTIWLKDDMGWSISANALRQSGFSDVKNFSDMTASDRGFIVRVQSSTNDLSTRQGTPFGGHATSADLSYRCPMGSTSMADISRAHTSAVTSLTSWNSQDFAFLTDQCDQFQQLSKGSAAPRKAKAKK